MPIFSSLAGLEVAEKFVVVVVNQSIKFYFRSQYLEQIKVTKLYWTVVVEKKLEGQGEKTTTTIIIHQELQISSMNNLISS